MMSILSAKKYQIFLFLLQYSGVATSAVQKMKNKVRKKKFPIHYRQINDSRQIQSRFFTTIVTPNEVTPVSDHSTLTEIIPAREKGITSITEKRLYQFSPGLIT